MEVLMERMSLSVDYANELHRLQTFFVLIMYTTNNLGTTMCAC